MTPLGRIDDQRSRLQPRQLETTRTTRMTPLRRIDDQRRFQPLQLDEYDFTWPALEPSHHTSLTYFLQYGTQKDHQERAFED